MNSAKKIDPSSHGHALSKLVEPMGLNITSAPIDDPEGGEYKACRLTLNGHKVVFRRAKITPKKQGLFVTLWRRSNESGKIEPLGSSEDFKFAIIEAQEKDGHGIFIFKKETLIDKKILALSGQNGKLAFRVYPPWSDTKSKQAVNSQRWQCKFFVPVLPNNKSSLSSAKHKIAEIFD